MRRDGETRVPRRYGLVKTRRAASAAPRFARFAPMFAAQVPSITLNSPNLGEFPRVFLDDDRTYSDYMKLDELGNLANFARMFADFSDAKISESSRKLRALNLSFKFENIKKNMQSPSHMDPRESPL